MQALPNHICPLCGGANECMAAQTGRLDVDCWCNHTRVSPGALARVPPDMIDRSCLCPRCAAGFDQPKGFSHEQQ
ncbi:cysteine-rich CWC family protein [Aquabacterium sp.]|uniref:cysteine-rich CWC family protein n=1 Tax=Aquabacterium sp. TaxID=1872578 RepID=UPI002E328001|nr:cysteine-rich CWC family protein [Aquabacterium sp.]HEX5310782.1 cysteine-rich CWC family protein [Aquabacterium sp.]